MRPTFKADDVVQAKTLQGESQRGDIVIITDNQDERAIKRIVGLPGETVTLYRGFVYIDSQRLNEPYLAKRTYTFKCSPEDESAVHWQLKADQYFLMGDNRPGSCDSRNYGPVERNQIKRVVTLPENSPKPGFCDLILSETGKVMPGNISRHNPARNRSRNHLPYFNAKI
jgi:signal peptidase I